MRMDADIIADELTKLTFDNMKVKEILTSRKQLIVGYRKEWLKSESSTNTKSTANVEQNSTGSSQSSGQSDPPGANGTTKSKNDGKNTSTSRGQTQADSSGHPQLATRRRMFRSMKRSMKSVTKRMSVLTSRPCSGGNHIRKLQTGEAFGMFVGDPNIHTVKVDYLPLHESPELRERVDALIEKNFESEFFISASRGGSGSRIVPSTTAERLNPILLS